MSTNPLSPSSIMNGLHREVKKFLPLNDSESASKDTSVSTLEPIQQHTRISLDGRTPVRPQDTARFGEGGLSKQVYEREAQARAQISQLEAEVDRLVREKEQLCEEARIRERRVVHASKRQAARTHQHVASLENRISDQQFRLSESARALAAQKEKSAKLEAMVIARQELALQALNAKKGPTPMEDHDVRRALRKLHMAIRSWAKIYAVSDVSDLEGIPASKLDLLVEELGSYCSETTWTSLNEKLSIPVNRVPDILVQAALSSVVFEWIFEDPFFLFHDMAISGSFSLSNDLGSIYHHMKQGKKSVDEVEAHAWRSQMLRLLSVPTEQSAKPLLGSQSGSLSRNLADQFIQSATGALLKEPESRETLETRVKELEVLLSEAADLALSLWTQRTDMGCYSLYELPQFCNGDPMVEAHRLHHLDDGDARLDCANNVLVVFPAVVAYGSVHGEHYDQSKVWAAATVLVNNQTADTKQAHSRKMSSSIKVEEFDQAKILPKAENSMKLKDCITVGKSPRVEAPVKVESCGSVEKRPRVEYEDADDPMVLDFV
ncbi:uncharacterized protein BO66DRAFT_463742 [Aspergillus aculeatinus CBS 121060]|uniref:Uncharacterized protein n=1 Tax=Aspergillus aculeatinus CBS 121060 TaxID=1448322 RepID=A0ACD1GTX9_9EURO|nr:hypothetical protein BO66DRAFT_463742 [Aspergillus aculeatinus CBS 121060]RAH64720.1 hypothetical protein BO66DRAFT_463742 [Aspergillus aculeatinus CBS 121060]